MGLFSAFGRNDDTEQNPEGRAIITADDDAEFEALASELGLKHRRSGKQYRGLSGELSGYRVDVHMTKSVQGIKVHFESGLPDFSIRSRAKNLKTNRVDVPTGDPAFDASFRLLLRKNLPSRAVLDY